MYKILRIISAPLELYETLLCFLFVKYIIVARQLQLIKLVWIAMHICHISFCIWRYHFEFYCAWWIWRRRFLCVSMTLNVKTIKNVKENINWSHWGCIWSIKYRISCKPYMWNIHLYLKIVSTYTLLLWIYLHSSG